MYVFMYVCVCVCSKGQIGYRYAGSLHMFFSDCVCCV